MSPVSDAAFYFPAPDDANAPEIHKGDLLLCDPERQPMPGCYVLAKLAGRDEPILARFAWADNSKKGAPTVIALIYADETKSGHLAPVADVSFIGLVTHRTFRMADVVPSEPRTARGDKSGLQALLAETGRARRRGERRVKTKRHLVVGLLHRIEWERLNRSTFRSARRQLGQPEAGAGGG